MESKVHNRIAGGGSCRLADDNITLKLENVFTMVGVEVVPKVVVQDWLTMITKNVD
uniref:Uncharacterized protein n=1 Tax=Cucumis melo TaxID=3656 RepID=A0A9I9D1Q2_CUCME